jgi:hypothetical protein
MAESMTTELRFVPSRVEGLPDVSEVAVFPDRIELLSAGTWMSFPFERMARYPKPKWLWRFLARLGWWKGFVPVGDRDWFHPPKDRYFRFYSSPAVIVYMPDEPVGLNYADTCFRHVQDMMIRGGYHTWDLG